MEPARWEGLASLEPARGEGAVSLEPACGRGSPAWGLAAGKGSLAWDLAAWELEFAQRGEELGREVPEDPGCGVLVDEENGEANRVICGVENIVRVVDRHGGFVAVPRGQGSRLRHGRARPGEI